MTRKIVIGAVIAGIVAPSLITPIAIVFACGIVPGVAMALYGWKILNAAGDLPMPEVKNPTELRTAISFGLLYAEVEHHRSRSFRAPCGAR